MTRIGHGNHAAEDVTSSPDEFRVTRRWRMTGGKRRSTVEATGGRRLLSAFPDKAGATEFVEQLGEGDTDLAGVRIVGKDLRLEEVVLGRVGWGRAILQSAVTGLLLGALVAAFLGLFDPVAPLSSAAFGLLFGALLGLVVGALVGAAWRARRGRRGFESATTMTAGRYEIWADRQAQRSLLGDDAH